MNRRLKTMGLVLVATVALSAGLASTASPDFEAESTPVTLETSSVETQKIQIKEGGTTAECTALALDNSTQTSSPTEEIAVEPTYSSCANLFGQKTSIHTNGCEYRFHLANGATTGTADIECPTSTGIQVTIGSLCTYEFDTQTGLSSVTYQNMGTSSTEEIKQVTNLQSVSVTRTTNHPPFICPAGGSNGTITGAAVETGRAFGFHVGIHVD